MTEPKVVLGGSEGSRRQWNPSLDVAWRLVGLLGALLVVVGLADLAITWWPLGFGNPEWEFGTVTATMNGLPVPTLGLVAVAAAARAVGWLKAARVVAVVLVGLTVVVVGGAVLYATTVPIAMKSVTNPVIQTGLTKAVIKTVVQCVAYPIGLTWLAVVAWRRLDRR
jgi:hypothetical protein